MMTRCPRKAVDKSTHRDFFVCGQKQRLRPLCRLGFWWLALCLLALASPVLAQNLEVDIKGTPIDELMQISVTTVSRLEEELRTSAAAAYVLTREEIRRARVTSVPEALRLIPGVQVAKIDANKWAVSIRGFNSRLANKLLVLVDGRSVYDPLFAGVFWEGRDVVLDEIERIEVVRGPGGTLWGSNAVNGVINIITRHARDTQGARATVAAGTEERAKTDVRYGWQPSTASHARLFADWFERDAGLSPFESRDEANRATGGFRLDWEPKEADQVMLSGHVFDGTFGPEQSLNSLEDLQEEGYSLISRWSHEQSASSQIMLQFWYDRFEFVDVTQFSEYRDTYDLEFQHNYRINTMNRLVWGAGYRLTSDDISNGPFITIVPSSRRDELSSLYLQDEIGLTAERALTLTLGTKIEHNDYTGTEWQPNARLAWTPNSGHTFWSAVSRAVRSPSRTDTDLVLLTIPFRGNPDFEAETLIAYEAGYRGQIVDQTWLDVALFHNVYRKLQSIEETTFGNKLRGATSGLEVAGRWQASPAWKYDLAYSYLDMDIDAEADSLDRTGAELIEGSDPRHQIALRSAWSPSLLIEVDATLRYVDRLRALNVPSYLVADFGVSYHPRPGIELSAVAQNLFDRSHPEQAGVMSTEVERGFYLKATFEL